MAGVLETLFGGQWKAMEGSDREVIDGWGPAEVASRLARGCAPMAWNSQAWRQEGLVRGHHQGPQLT